MGTIAILLLALVTGPRRLAVVGYANRITSFGDTPGYAPDQNTLLFFARRPGVKTNTGATTSSDIWIWAAPENRPPTPLGDSSGWWYGWTQISRAGAKSRMLGRRQGLSINSRSRPFNLG